MAVLVDANALVALADNRDRRHGAVLSFTSEARESLLIPASVLPEVDYLVTRTLGVRAAIAMLRSISGDDFRIESVAGSDYARCVDLMSQYAGSDIGFVDASIVTMAERLRITRILTYDYRHFRMIRPRHCAAFELVP